MARRIEGYKWTGNRERIGVRNEMLNWEERSTLDDL